MLNAIFDRIFHDSCDYPQRWQVRVDGHGYHCRWFGATQERDEELDGGDPSGSDLVVPGETMTFTVKRSAIDFFATDYDQALQLAAEQFFAEIP